MPDNITRSKAFFQPLSRLCMQLHLTRFFFA